jgi:predicted  nucleic acid-binding Zn-ribbon protein
MERLQSLLETERRNNESLLKQQGERQERDLERVREDHRDELKNVANRIESLEKECARLERQVKEAHQAAEQQQQQSSADIDTLMQEKKKLQGELAAAVERANTVEKQHETERAAASIRESEEREKVRLLMERLEVNGANLEKKQQAVEREQKAIAEQKEQIREEYETLRQAQEDLEERFEELQEKVCTRMLSSYMAA